MTSSQQDQDLRALVFVHDHDEGACGSASPAGLWELLGEQEGSMSAASLKARGLIRDDNRASGGYHITGPGKEIVEALRQRQANRARRRNECRDQLLRWVDDNTTPSAGSRIGREKFDGSVDLLVFTDEEVTAAAGHLHENGLINSITSGFADHVLLWITERGRECVDAGGTVLEFLDRERINIGGQTFHVSGSGNSIAAAIGSNNEVTASIAQFDPELAHQFASAVRQAMPVLELPADVEDMLRDIEQRADPSRAQRATAMLYTFLMGSTTGTLGQVLGVLGANALGIGS